jgi:Fe-S-cluster containining protein
MRPLISPHLTALAGKTDDWFRRASAGLLNQVPCRAGCSHCCKGVFPITRLDVRLLEDGLARLPSDQRKRIEERAVHQTAELEAAYPQLEISPSLDGWSDEEIDHAVHAFRDVPCPALGSDGLCALYAYRPLTCRSMGIPTRQDATVNGACSVQTFVPIVRLSASLETEEQELAASEAALLEVLPEVATEGEELLVPYAFVPARLKACTPQTVSSGQRACTDL